jgi:hypothetical protein
MFRSVAKSLHAEMNERPYIDAAQLGEEEHESENLVEIGPFQAAQQ